MSVVLKIIAFVGSFAAMEFVAWLTHKYIMHGFLWSLHEDHHHKEHRGFFERNDLFFFIFATPSIVLLYLGYTNESLGILAWVGGGIALYGMAYLFVHDIFVHQRVKIISRTNNIYLKAMQRAHKVHHKTIEKEGAESFGFLVPARKYIKGARDSVSHQ